VPDDGFLDRLGNVDILFLPVGGFYTIDASEAWQLVKKIEPRRVIPMHYNHPKLNQNVFGNLTPVEEFTKKIGIEKPELLPKLVYKKEEEEGEIRVVVLEIG
jgi:L-ascorbate metabolism protein UlaG (beta-lactamase superfamily)